LILHFGGSSLFVYCCELATNKHNLKKALLLAVGCVKI